MTRHHPLTRAFHWFVVVAVAIMVPAGITMTSEPLVHFADPIYVLHKGLGAVLLIVVPLRLGWRLLRPPPPLPDAVPAGQARVMGRTHAALYALLLVMVLSGYVRTVAGGFPIELLEAVGVPPLLPESERAARVALVTHQLTAYALVMLVAVHAGAAVHDWKFGRKGIWRRMWPPWKAADP